MGRKTQQTRLFYREWFVVLVVLSFGFFFFIVAQPVFCKEDLRRVLACGSPAEKTNQIQVEVRGAVLRPGMYRVDRGTSVQAVLKQAGLFAASDISALYKNKGLFQSCLIVVPVIGMQSF